MSSSAPPAAVAVADIAELVHQAFGATSPTLLSVAFDGSGNVELATWHGFHPTARPADSLVRFRAPCAWQAIGLIAGGRGRTVSGLAAPASPDLLGGVVVTAVVDRQGNWANVLGHLGEAGRALPGAPEGLVPDVLNRCLGRATPPPTDSPALWVEKVWLHRLAATVLDRPGEARTWRDLADRHPLAGSGGLASAAELAHRTATYARQSWEVLRVRHAAEEVARLDIEPPRGPGAVIDAGQWFDDGSFSRWVMRDLPPAGAVLLDLVAVLADPLADRLVMALSTATLADFGLVAW